MFFIETEKASTQFSKKTADSLRSAAITRPLAPAKSYQQPSMCDLVTASKKCDLFLARMNPPGIPHRETGVYIAYTYIYIT